MGQRWAGINQYKPAVAHSIYLVKPWHAQWFARQLNEQNQHLDLLILGTSRAGGSINPRAPSFEGQQAYNFALPLASIYQTRLAWQHMRRFNPAQLLLTLDFFTFNHAKAHTVPGQDPALEARLLTDNSLIEYWHQLGQRTADTLLQLATMDATRKSIQTIAAQHKLASGQIGAIDLEHTGFWRVLPPKQRDIRRHFEQGLAFSVRRFCDRSAPFSFADAGNHPSTLEQLASLLDDLYQRDIKVTLAIPAVHVWYLAALHECDLWDKREEWKQQLVQINEQMAKLHGKTAFPLWDFSDINSITSETIAGPEPLQWFHDIDHPTPVAGELMWSRINGWSSLADDYGRPLDKANISGLLAQERKGMSEYLTRNPDLKHQLQDRIQERHRQQSQGR